jgi:hypothetical protein
VAGLIFALVYFAVFAALGTSGWWLGAVFGFVHAVFAATALVSILLPLIHPRMGTALTATGSVALLEPPGFIMLNYGARTPLVTLAAHIAYGAIVGGFVSLSG